MRFYLAEIVELGLDLACAITNHAGGCWVLRFAPFRRIWVWALDVQYVERDYVSRHDCPYCSAEIPRPSNGHQWEVVESHTRNGNHTGNSAAQITWRQVGT